MAEKGHGAGNKKIQVSLLASAINAAVNAVEKTTNLRGGDSRKAGAAAVEAARPQLRAEYACQLAQTRDATALAVFGAAVTALVCDAVIAAAVIRRGPSWARPVGVVSLAGRAALLGYSRYHEAQLKTAARRYAADQAGAPR